MIRLSVRIRRGAAKHAELDLFVNGQMVSGPCGITIRAAEITGFLAKLDPDTIEVDRENITDDMFHRLAGFKNTRFV